MKSTWLGSMFSIGSWAVEVSFNTVHHFWITAVFMQTKIDYNLFVCNDTNVPHAQVNLKAQKHRRENNIKMPSLIWRYGPFWIEGIDWPMNWHDTYMKSQIKCMSKHNNAL